MIRNRSKRPAAEATVPAEPQSDLDDLAAEAEAHRRDADDARSRAVQARADAEARLAGSRAEAQRIVQAAEAEARTLTADAAAADREAERADERARQYAAAARLQAQCAEADDLVAAITTEREQLGARIAALDDQTEALRSERGNLTEQLATARSHLDRDLIASLRAKIDATDDVLAELAAQRKAPQDRLTAIGDGTGRGELFDALTAARARASDLRQVLNVLDPGRPEARADEFLAIVEANRQRIAAEASAPARPPRSLVTR
jgi:ribonucrease Y